MPVFESGFPASSQVPDRDERLNGKKQRVHRCRSCKSTAVERDWRTTRFERLMLPLIGRKTYVCRDCRARFYDRPIHQAGW